MDCGGKRSATLLFERVRIAKPQNHALDDNTAVTFDSAPPLRKRRRRCALLDHSPKRPLTIWTAVASVARHRFRTALKAASRCACRRSPKLLGPHHRQKFFKPGDELRTFDHSVVVVTAQFNK